VAVHIGPLFCRHPLRDSIHVSLLRDGTWSTARNFKCRLEGVLGRLSQHRGPAAEPPSQLWLL